MNDDPRGQLCRSVGGGMGGPRYLNIHSLRVGRGLFVVAGRWGSIDRKIYMLTSLVLPYLGVRLLTRGRPLALLSG